MKIRLPENDRMDRAFCTQQLQDPGTVWDILVIGGGATGLGIALDAVMRGYKTLVLEQADFAKGTSSRSTKLVHGGVRYLAQGEIRLVREASIERARLYQNAPHLVKNQTFIIPVYSQWERLKYTLGLKCYDWVAGRKRMGSSGFLSRKETTKQLPGIKPEKLVGGVLYHDGQFDDARLALNLAQTIWDNGGYAVNYVSVTGLIKTADGKVSGVRAKDAENGQEYRLMSKVVVNATGVFADDILQMETPGSPKTLCVSQGVHLVLDKKFYPSDDALMIPETSDGRVLFAVPWHDHVVVGTTDTLVKDASLEPVALEKEISFILETAAAYFIKKPERSDVLSVFAGLRPLAAPQNGKQKTKEISRSHKIVVSTGRLFTIIGGKWTTYRKMGEDMVNRIEQEMGWKKSPAGTANLSIHGKALNMNWKDPFYYYGSEAARLTSMMNGNADTWISEKLRIHEVQVVWAVEHEMARTLEDVLARRTRALLLDAKESMRIARPVAAIMAIVLNKDEHWINEQVKEFTELADQYTLH